jgi:hypothetical protein
VNSRRHKQKLTHEDVPMSEWRKRLGMVPEEIACTTQYYINAEIENWKIQGIISRADSQVYDVNDRTRQLPQIHFFRWWYQTETIHVHNFLLRLTLTDGMFIH